MADEKETKQEEAQEEQTEETSTEETSAEETATEETQEAASSDEAQTEEAAETGDDSAGEVSSDDASSDEGEDVEVPEKFQSLVEQIETMSVLDLNELVKLLEKKFGVSAVAVAAGGGGAEGGGEEEEKDSFTVHLAGAGDNKIQVIKAVKGALGLGLKEAKELVEGAPADLKADMPKEEAEELKSQVEEAGGTIELK